MKKNLNDVCHDYITMSLVHAFETLFGTEKSGKTKIWSASVYRNDDGTAYSLISFGQEDGKMQETRREYQSGKNIGKKNETTPVQQCMSETERKWRDKMEKEGYRTNRDDDEKDVSDTIYPMLAQTYDPTSSVKKKKTINFPCAVQPKIDGLRCLMYFRDGHVVCQSRTGGTFQSVNHIAAVLHPLLQQHTDWAIDGELYTHNYPFEELAGLIKKVKLKPEDLEKLSLVQYHVYDAVCLSQPQLTFAQRWSWIQTHLPQHATIVRVLTQTVNSLTDFRATFAHYVADGWEGIMLRNHDGEYAQNFRSHDLQKYKEFMEEEFPIVGWKEGEGRDAGTVIWLCENRECVQFAVRPRGSLEQRRDWLQKAPTLIGKNLTVIFQEWSEKRVPRFPVGKDIRENY